MAVFMIDIVAIGNKYDDDDDDDAVLVNCICNLTALSSTLVVGRAAAVKLQSMLFA